jgi:putative endonuclease
MYYVYVLFSLKDRKLYVGLSNNLIRRLRQHKYGEVKSTRNRRPLILVHYETFNLKIDAERTEKYLKGGNGRANLKIKLKYHLSKLRYKHI